MIFELLQTADAIKKDGKQIDKAVDRKDRLVDDNMISNDNMVSDPQTHKNAVRKGGRISWWNKLIDDNINDRRFPKDTIRRDDRNVNLAQKADGFRQGSTGHSAQDLNNKRHIMRKWDPKSKIKQDSEKSSRGSWNKHNHVNAEQVRCLETTEKESSERDHRNDQEAVVSAAKDSDKFEKENTRKEKAMDNPTDPTEIEIDNIIKRKNGK